MGGGSAVETGGVRATPQRYSRVFLAVFAVLLVATIICALGMVLGVLEAQPSHHDTLWFWASGHLLAHGNNPYDAVKIRQMENALGLRVRSDLPMTRNPPPSLLFMLPLGLFPAREGVVVWSMLLALCLWLSVRTTKSMLEEPYEHAYVWLAWCFAPALSCIEMGQTGIIVLLGLVLFLRFYADKPFWAGAGLSMCAIKPHLLLPFGLVLLVWIAARRRWKILAGAIAGLVLESLVVMAFDHAVWAHYRTAMHAQDIVDEFVPTLGVALRFLVDRTAMWIEFVPAAAGCAWGLWYFRRNGERWDWRTHGSLLVMVSLVAAPYSWFTDQVIALPAILFALTGPRPPRRGSLTLLLAVMSVGAIEMIAAKSLYFKPYLWEGVAWLAWYVYAVGGRAAVNGEVVESAAIP